MTGLQMYGVLCDEGTREETKDGRCGRITETGVWPGSGDEK